jgi:aspartate/methionine/tyrosine aminotransferase
VFSDRTAWDLSPNALAVALRERRDRGLPIVDLTESNPTRVGFDYPSTDIVAALSSPSALRYEPSPLGLAGAREAVARSLAAHGAGPIDAGRIVLTASSSESYAFLLSLLCDPGDSVLVPRPSYPLLAHLARLAGVGLRGYSLREGDRWRVDHGSVQRACEPRTRAILVVSPNNPTGSYLVREEHEALQAFACDRGMALVCDEVFAEHVWRDDPERVACAAAEARALTFSLGGLSKSACLPQVKLGWIVAGGPDAEVREALARLEMIADTFLSVGSPVQIACGRLLESAEPVRRQVRERVEANLGVLERAIGPDSPVSLLECRAGWYAVLRVPSVMSDEAWAVKLVEQQGVVVHPGSFFGFERPGYLVAGLLGRVDETHEAAQRIMACVERAC